MIKFENELRSGKWIQTNPTLRRLQENYAGKGIGRGDDEEGFFFGRTVLQQQHRVVTWCLKRQFTCSMHVSLTPAECTLRVTCTVI